MNVDVTPSNMSIDSNMNLVYSNPINTTYASNTTSSLASPMAWQSSEYIQSVQNAIRSKVVENIDKRSVYMRLLRYTVIDPDPILADTHPDHSILLHGILVFAGTDDRGLLMELGPKVEKLLEAHNMFRNAVEYETYIGGGNYVQMRKLSPVKLSQLDVVVEVVKEYKK